MAPLLPPARRPPQRGRFHAPTRFPGTIFLTLCEPFSVPARLPLQAGQQGPDHDRNDDDQSSFSGSDCGFCSGCHNILPSFAPPVEASVPQVLAKTDRLPVRAVSTACAGQNWPNIDVSCLRRGNSNANDPAGSRGDHRPKLTIPNVLTHERRLSAAVTVFRPSVMCSTETTCSSSAVSNTITPWVERPAMRMSSTGQRINWPFIGHQHDLIAVLDRNDATSLPLRLLTDIATMPFPPRPVVRYSNDELRLP